jgi:hypothetical protein
VPATRELGLWPAQSNGVKSTASGVRMGTGWLKGTGPVELDYPFELVLAATQGNWLLLCCQFVYIDIYEGFYFILLKKTFSPLHFVTFFFFFFLGGIFGLLGRTRREEKKKVYENNNSFPFTLSFWEEQEGRKKKKVYENNNSFPLF